MHNLLPEHPQFAPIQKLVLADKRKLGIILLGCTALSIVSGLFLPTGVDWHLTFRPVSMLVIQGGSPYTQALDMPFPYAPWILLPILPFGLLPENIGRGAFFIVSIIGFCIFALRFGANRFRLLAFLISPPVLHCLLNANLDWIPLFGYVLPPQIGLFFLVTKPQVGIGGVMFWLFTSWKNGGIKEVFHTFLPVSIALIFSFVIYGFWPLTYTQAVSYGWNAALWPLALPVGLCLIVLACRYRNIRYSIAASPCVSPYVLFHSWSGVMGLILNDNWLTFTAVAGLWAIILMKALGAA